MTINNNMATFRFNFSGNENEIQIKEKKEDIEWLESEELLPNIQIKDLDKIVLRAKFFICHDVEIGHVVINDALNNIEQSGLQNIIDSAEKEHSDLIAGKYEGGLKIWECTYDLMQYLIEIKDKIHLKGGNILDLGCGAGILGIYAFINGGFVTFQDYNKEVLEHVTIPNVLLNIEEEEREMEIKRCKFYSGDWESFNKKLDSNEKYDIIFTSETIYNESNYNKLTSLFEERLKKDGIIFVAAKTCYFGVGGGIRQFEKHITKTDSLNSEVCWKSTGGIQREIIKITRTS